MKRTHLLNLFSPHIKMKCSQRLKIKAREGQDEYILGYIEETRDLQFERLSHQLVNYSVYLNNLK